MAAINTASLPGYCLYAYCFSLLTTTVMKEVNLMINVKVPEATEARKLEKKSLVSHIYIGQPLRSFQKMYGTEPRIQLNDQFKDVADIVDFIAQERDAMDENNRNKMTVSLKIDSDTRMGTVIDVKQSLRRAQALKISYSARQVAKL